MTLPLVACGGRVVVDSVPGATAGAGGSATSGLGGAAVMSSNVDAASTTAGAGAGVVGAASTGGGGSGSGCSGGFIDLTIDGSHVALGSSCTGDVPPVPVAFGRVFEGSSVPSYQDLSLSGCATAAFYSQGVIIVVDNVMGTGQYKGGSVVYDDAKGVMWSGVAGGFQATISEFGPVGGFIVGSFQETIAYGNVTQLLQGKFSVCRLPDAVAP